jgi:RNA-directed DNA polymerase
MDHGELFPTPSGSPQGGCLSPLLANIALHGMEDDLIKHCRTLSDREPRTIRYADDFVVLHKDKAVVEECQRFTTGWLKQMGLEPKPSKTRVTHTLERGEHEPGFDFLGFHIRQESIGKTRSGRRKNGKPLGFKTRIKPSQAAVQRHVEKLRGILRKHRSVDQELLITLLAPIIVGWCNYFAVYACTETFRKLSGVLFAMLRAWALRRHPKKRKHWVMDKYWRVGDGGGWRFGPRGSTCRLPIHPDTSVKIHTKVAGRRSPYDGDWVYWSTRMGREPTTPDRVARLLREQDGRCRECGLYFRADDRMEIDHVRPKIDGGTDARRNRQLLHRHCHDHKTARDKEVRMKSAMPSRSRVR